MIEGPARRMTRSLAAYEALTACGKLQEDPVQAEVARRLDSLAEAIADHRSKGNGLLGRLGRGRSPEAPRGIYLHGPVGSGKSMLMDLFFEAVDRPKKRRVHFHEFMLEVHRRLHEHRRADREGDPLGPLARDLAAEARILCFDELAVHNIADAMILSRLFEGLFENGVVMVATSNFPPERLYEDGLNRERFLPFIDLLERHLEVIEVDGGTDYRLARLRDLAVYHQPLGPEAQAALERAFAVLTDDAVGGPQVLEVGARQLKVPKAAQGVAWFDFKQLCEQPLGAADYLALTERYHTIILAGIPVLTPELRNEARRLMTLVDALYERRVKLIASAAAPPHALYAAGDGAFEFRRTASRLAEMQTRAYLESAKAKGRPDSGFAAFALTTDLI
jgi:cell division protein ZapE